MTVNDKTLIDWALQGIAQERKQLDSIEADLRRKLTDRPEARSAIRTRTSAPSSTRFSATLVAPRSPRKKMSAAQRRKISSAMKARWAKVQRVKT